MAVRTGAALFNPLRSGVNQSVFLGNSSSNFAVKASGVNLFFQFRHFSDDKTTSDDSSSKPAEESWLSRFLRFDVSKTSHSTVVGSQNILYKLVFIRAKPEHQVRNTPFYLQIQSNGS